jgi:hypothetical protein
MNTTDLDWTQFNKQQANEILEGLKRNLDVSIYARPEFDRWQMKEIRLGLENSEENQ